MNKENLECYSRGLSTLAGLKGVGGYSIFNIDAITFLLTRRGRKNIHYKVCALVDDIRHVFGRGKRLEDPHSIHSPLVARQSNLHVCVVMREFGSGGQG